MSIVGKIVSYTPKVWKYGTKLVKASPYIIFHDAAQGGISAARQVTRSANQSWRSVFKQAAKEGILGIENSANATKSAQGGFFKAAWKSISEIPSVLKTGTKWGFSRAFVTAKAAGKSGFIAGLSGIKGGATGLLKSIGKKMPIIGNIMLVAFELPNIFNAVKDEGIVQGGKEVLKTGARLTVASLASAAGAAIGGPLGGIAGFMLGDWLTSLVVGKSYTEQKAEKEQQAAEDMTRAQELLNQQGITTVQQPQMAQVPFTGNTAPFQPMYNQYGFGGTSINPYSNDIMMQSINFDAIA